MGIRMVEGWVGVKVSMSKRVWYSGYNDEISVRGGYVRLGAIDSRRSAGMGKTNKREKKRR